MTSHSKSYFNHVSIHLSSHVCETSPGKNAIFLSIYLPHLQRKLSDTLGLQFVEQPYPVYSALYVVSVRQTRDLPPTSSRFHLTMDTLVFGYALGTIYPRSGLSPVRLRPCRAHPEEPGPQRPAVRVLLTSFYSKMALRSFSGVVIGCRLNFSTRMLSTLGDRKAGSDGPI